MKIIKSLLILLTCFGAMASWANSQAVSTQSQKSTTETNISDKPLVERYILDELKSTRHELQDLERRLTIEITDRELDIAERSISHAQQIVDYFFYIIAAVASMIALFGWKSLHQLRISVSKKADLQIKKIADSYEEKFKQLEKELRRKTRGITQNHEEIEKINEIHNLWLRAQKHQTAKGKMEIYDAILKIRPGDLEALTSKADAAMELKEFHWALSICNRVIDMDERNYNAYYQRACAYACLGVVEQALEDLGKAINGRNALRELALDESDFENLRDNEIFNALLHQNESP